MSNRVGFALATLLLLLAAGLRLWDLGSLPLGLDHEEVTDIRISEAIRSGNISVFYNLEPLGEQGGREGLFHTLLTAVSTFTGKGLLGYRALSALSNLVMLALVYALATRLYGPLAGVAALALLVVGLWPVLLARSVIQATMLPLLVAAVLLTLARALPVYYHAPATEPGTMPFAALGLLLGLGFYIHPAHFLLVLGVMLFIVYMVLSRQPLSLRTLSYIGFAILVMIIIAMPYLISSIRLPELGGATRVFGDYTVAANPPLQAIVESLIGIFFRGDTNPTHNLPGRPLVDLVSGLIIIIGLLAALNQWRRPRFTLPLMALLVLFPIAFLTVHSPDFEAFSALLPVLALLFGLGVTTLFNMLPRQSRPVLGLGLIVLLVFNGVWLGRDLFQTWPTLDSTYQAYDGRIGQLARYIDHSAGTLPTLVCTPGLNQTTPQENLTQTQLLLMMMNTSGRNLRYADCGTGLVFSNGGERQQVVLTGAEGLDGVHPYLRDWLTRGHSLRQDDLPEDSVIVVDVSQPLADTIGRFTTTAPLGYAPEVPDSDQIVFPPVTFGGNLTFLGYELDDTETYHPGDIVTSITYWRVDGPLPSDLRLFTHILSDPAAIISQTDTLSVLPSFLKPRDVFVQITFVPLPRSTPKGQYSLSIGAYQDTSDQRLSILEADQERGTRLFLIANSITVE